MKEILVPSRKIVQQIEPVKEIITTNVARGIAHAKGPIGGGGLGLGLVDGLAAGGAKGAIIGLGGGAGLLKAGPAPIAPATYKTDLLDGDFGLKLGGGPIAGGVGGDLGYKSAASAAAAASRA